MIGLLARLLMRSIATWRSRAIVAGGAVAISDVINIDFLRRQALEIAPGSDREALEEAARTAARLLGLEGDEVLWPRRRSGEPIIPQYLIVDLNRGRAWYSARYYSRKSVNAGRRRGWGRGFRGGQRSIATISQAQGR